MKKILIILLILPFNQNFYAQDFNELMEVAISTYHEYDLEKAEELFSKAISLNPKSGEAYYYLGSCYEYKNPKEAESNWLKAVEVEPTYEYTYISLYHYYSSNDEDEKAKMYLLKGLELNPEDSNNLLLMAQMYRKEGDIEKAMLYCDKSIAQFKNEGEFLAVVERAEIKFQLKDYAGAIDDFETCFYKLTFGMYTSHQFELCGDAHFELGQKEKACEKWEMALSHPDVMEPSESAGIKIKKYCK